MVADRYREPGAERCDQRPRRGPGCSFRLREVFPTFAPEVRRRWVRNAPFLITGVAGMIGGGFVAAVAGAVDWKLGAWTAAFVVLVVGMAQTVLGIAQAALAPVLLDRSRIVGQWVAWNLGCAGVIAGTQLDATGIVVAGCVLFLGALGLSEVAVRPHSGLTGTPRTLLMIYRVLLVLLLISVFVGIVLSIVGY